MFMHLPFHFLRVQLPHKALDMEHWSLPHWLPAAVLCSRLQDSLVETKNPLSHVFFNDIIPPSDLSTATTQ